jgi:dihydroorotase
MNKVKIPSLCDLHVHLREPGFEYKEDITSGVKSAYCGGYGDIVAMPNTDPPVDNLSTINYIRGKLIDSPVNVIQSACITRGMRGQTLADFAMYKDYGVTVVTDDGKPVLSNALMEAALLKAKRYGLLLFDHCEDPSLPGNHPASETVIVARDIALSRCLQAKIHICHVSAKESVQMIRAAKRDGVQITCETAPHYLCYTNEKLKLNDADYKMNPPLRAEEDRQALIKGLKDGTIDCIATDHAPHSPDEKAGFKNAPNGVIGMETAFPAMYTFLVKTGELYLERLIYLMSTRPREILGLPKTEKTVEWDLEEMWRVDVDNLHGKSKNCIFKNEILYGKPSLELEVDE